MNIFAMVTTKASWEYTSYALKSFFRNTRLEGDDKLYLIDNDLGFEEEASWFSPALEIIKNDAPKGFSENMNQVMQIASAKGADLYILQNDVIFTSEWAEPLAAVSDSVVSCISNANTEYSVPGFEWKEVMKLNQYLGRESKLKEIITQHKSKSDGYKKTLSCPFFCLKIPRVVYERTGSLDESYKTAGCEDHDYCLRAWQLGFEVKYARKSLLLHFAGKSTWAGAEKSEQTAARNEYNSQVFEKKWGSILKKICIDKDLSPLEENEKLKQSFNDEKYMEFVDLCRN